MPLTYLTLHVREYPTCFHSWPDTGGLVRFDSVLLGASAKASGGSDAAAGGSGTTEDGA